MSEAKLLPRSELEAIAARADKANGLIHLYAISKTDIPALLSHIAALEARVAEAAQTFRTYEQLHRDKGTPDGLQKAERNAALAARMEEVLPAPPSETKP